MSKYTECKQDVLSALLCLLSLIPFFVFAYLIPGGIPSDLIGYIKFSVHFTLIVFIILMGLGLFGFFYFINREVE